ncbi:MAG: TrmH family RNA methyltransferase [Candidatus Taylorbacteria bacterium]
MISLILYNIRSAGNVGSIFRTADAAGVSRIFLAGYTPTPTDQFERERKDIAKVALGAEKVIPWTFAPDIEVLLQELKGKTTTLIALEQDKRSVDYKTVSLSGDCALIVGEEVHGLTQNILDQCDIIAEIPMKGEKESLNVSVATGIALFKILNI